MLTPIDVLTTRAAEALGRAFGPDLATADPVVRPAQQPRFGDFQLNAAMGLGKRLGLNPREVAQRWVAALQVDDVVERVEIAGPGFINLWLRQEWLSQAVTAMGGDPRLGVAAALGGESIMVDYSAPNVAKEMHVGHLRSTIIGDALAKVFEELGARVIRHNHIGDWGTQFGMLVEHVLETLPDIANLHIDDLDDLYRQARRHFEEDGEFADRARRRVVALQAGDETTMAVWRRLVEESQRHFAAVYELLDVTLGPDDADPESRYNDVLADVVAELEGKGLTSVDDGAVCVFPPGVVGREGEPLPMIVRKSDGAYGYAATDLAAARRTLTELGASRLVYVVDARQSLHFAMVFAVARMAGWASETARLEHVPFGTVLGEDGKPLKSREGDNVRLADLLREAAERARRVIQDKQPDLQGDDLETLARQVGVGAVKYADLANGRVKDYVFSWDRMLAMEGNTAPYLQYAQARIRSILRRAGDADVRAPIALVEPQERALGLALLRFPDVVSEVAETLEPHRLSVYLYDLATAFTGFYEHCPVLQADSAEVRSSRLALCAVTAEVLRRGLWLLGIAAPERL